MYEEPKRSELSLSVSSIIHVKDNVIACITGNRISFLDIFAQAFKLLLVITPLKNENFNSESFTAFQLLDLNTLITSGDDLVIRFWDLTSLKDSIVVRKENFIQGEIEKVYSLCTLSSNRIATGNSVGKVYIWNISLSEQIVSFTGHWKNVSLLLRLSYRQLASSDLTCIIVWDVDAKICSFQLDGSIKKMIRLNDSQFFSISEKDLKVIGSKAEKKKFINN